MFLKVLLDQVSREPPKNMPLGREYGRAIRQFVAPRAHGS